MNGTLGTIERTEGRTLTIKLDALGPNEKARTVTVDTGQYNHFDHGYAATVHKAQGVDGG